MRFELGLRELPDLTPDQAKAKLATLPKGVSTGVILKGLQEGYVPSVTIAWSEDKRVINELEDRLTDIGFKCYVVDHGFFVFRIVTKLGELLGRSRYRKVEKEDRTYISLGEGNRKKSIAQSPLARFALLYFAQVLVVEGLYLWRLGIRMGAVNLTSAKDLSPQLAAVAAGFLAAYVLTTAINAYRAGKLSAPLAAPLVLLSVGCTIGALFFVKVEHDAERDSRAIGRPASNPYAGLLVELRKRNAGKPLAERSEANAFTTMQDGLGEDSEALECFEPSEWGHPLDCAANLMWEESLACLPSPAPPKRPKLQATQVSRAPPALAQAVASRATKRVVVVRPWGVTFELVHLSELVLVWLLSLVGVFLLATRRWRATSRAAPLVAESAGTALPVEAPVDSVQVLMLQAELTEVNAQLAHSRQFSGDAQLVQALQSQLAETQASLAQHQTAIANVRQQVGPIKEMHAAQVAEIERLQELLSQAHAQLATFQAARPMPLRPRAPANTQETTRRAYVDPRAEPDEPEEPSRTHRRRP